jgi:hypothetical protein
MTRFTGAVIKEQGVKFGVVSVKRSAFDGPDRDRLAFQASRMFGGIPTVLADLTARRPRYYGRGDLTRFLASIPVSAIPWRDYRVN